MAVEAGLGRRSKDVNIKYMTSVLLVKDVEASREFYEGLLGQSCIMNHGGVHVVFEGGFAIWQADYAYNVLFKDREAPAQGLGADNAELYFEAENLDDVWMLLADKGVPVLHPVQEQPWGQRCFRVYDPDGHMIELGEPMWVVVKRFLGKGLTPDETARRTSMPLDVVHEIDKGMP